MFHRNIQLACVKHTISIYSEPGSNSIKDYKKYKF